MSRTDTTSSKPTEVLIHSTRPDVLEAVSDFAATIEKALDSDETSIRGLVDAMATYLDTPHPAHEKQLRANADLRARFMREVPWLTSFDIARFFRVETAVPEQWKSERRVFSVAIDGIERFPFFQFADRQPIAAMHDVLALFAGLSDWQIALWFFAPNAWLGDASPMAVLPRDPDGVIEAARRAVEPLEV